MDEAIKKPWWAVIGPDEGESLWQPLPSRGYVTLKLTPESMPYDSFTSGIQVLSPGCHVRGHGHRQNHELLFIYEGSGEVEIEGQTYAAVKGTTVLFGRYTRHSITNTGAVDMALFWVFMPPGLEHWFRGIGIQRQPGDELPEAFPRSDKAGDLMQQMLFVPPAKT
jgi:mannose-6-phosphate isomerase-like protein (cupin superfamily)